ncbi:hypothetical protein SDC9_187368 [bioreactor metagenome]|uniref:Uncharacterized protein n=1 Tax=bioreactor metagenome TaxID=1076179 RepID=A0A645HUJ8_9ZZZZ
MCAVYNIPWIGSEVLDVGSSWRFFFNQYGDTTAINLISVFIEESTDRIVLRILVGLFIIRVI